MSRENREIARRQVARRAEIDSTCASWQIIKDRSLMRINGFVEELKYKEFSDLCEVRDVQARIQELEDLLDLAETKEQPRASL